MKAKLKQLYKVFKYKCGFLLFHGETTTCSVAFMLQIEVGNLLGAVGFCPPKDAVPDPARSETEANIKNPHFNKRNFNYNQHFFGKLREIFLVDISVILRRL